MQQVKFVPVREFMYAHNVYTASCIAVNFRVVKFIFAYYFGSWVWTAKIKPTKFSRIIGRINVVSLTVLI